VQLDGRTIQGDFYRKGFNGMEKDDEVKGGGNSYDFGARMYDSRVGRFLSLDPLMSKFPWQSPYVAFNNNPIFFVDPNGQEAQPFLGIVLEAIKGGFIGGASEYTFQVADNMIFEGMEIPNAIKNVNWSDIGVEALNGAVQEMIPFNAYSALKMREMFTGKYRKTTMYLIKQSIEGLESMMNESLKSYLDGEEINLTETLTSVLGEQLVGEIISAKPFIHPSFKRQSSKITKLTEDAKRLQKLVTSSKDKLGEVSDSKSIQKIQKQVSKLEKQRNKKMDKATDLLAKQYTKFVGGKTTEDVIDRARKKIGQKVYASISIGPLNQKREEK
jgi:RHS repeat-associated protein